ncbi:MAG: glycosyltransferase family 2 protein [Cyanobacteriota bacterium]
MTQTPVLLLIWRRPHTLRLVLDALRPAAPRWLYVACDGPDPRRAGEADDVAAARKLIECHIDWPCRIERFYASENQGCRLGVSRAISWFFNQVEEGIILEDDCVPHPDFFPFCSTLLERYRHDTRVWGVGGNNFQQGRWRGDGSYYFSHYFHSWGWASWRRCWQHYDGELSQLYPLIESGYLSTIFPDPLERKSWIRLWRRLLERGKPDSWAYRWAFTCLLHGGLLAIPNRNLVSNVGFGEGATHTFRQANRAVRTAIDQGLGPLETPSFLLRDMAADRFTFNKVFGGDQQRFPGVLLRWPLRAARALSRPSPPRGQALRA